MWHSLDWNICMSFPEDNQNILAGTGFCNGPNLQWNKFFWLSRDQISARNYTSWRTESGSVTVEADMIQIAILVSSKIGYCQLNPASSVKFNENHVWLRICAFHLQRIISRLGPCPFHRSVGGMKTESEIDCVTKDFVGRVKTPFCRFSRTPSE